MAFAFIKDGLNVKALLLTNPNDPLGVMYSSSVILAAVNWARRRSIHILVDEIYALSIHSVSATVECFHGHMCAISIILLIL